jgi:hypothetical protein
MLNRSTPAYRDNFASNVAQVEDDPTGYVAKVVFTGRDGKKLIALIEDDCYIGWAVY